MGNLYSVLRNVYQTGNHAELLNDGDFFLQQIAGSYEPAFKLDCQLIERAIRQGAGNIVYQYIQQNRIPTVSETDEFLRQMQNRADFSAAEAQRAVGFLYYMVGWNQDGTTNTTQQAAPPPRPTPEPVQPPKPAPAPVQPVNPTPPPRQAPSQASGSGSGFRDFLSSTSGRVILTIILYVLYFVAFYAILAWVGQKGNGAITMVVGLPVLAITTFFGWKALGGLKPGVFLILPGLGWALYGGIKTTLALFIGIFVTPYQFAKMIIRKL